MRIFNILFIVVIPLRVCIGSAWLGFGSRSGNKGGFCDKLLEASSRPREQIPVGSNMDVVLDKATGIHLQPTEETQARAGEAPGRDLHNMESTATLEQVSWWDLCPQPVLEGLHPAQE